MFWLFFLLNLMAYSCFTIAVSISDALCFDILKEKHHQYGAQRVWGSIGWGLFTVRKMLLPFSPGLQNCTVAHSFCYSFSYSSLCFSPGCSRLPCWHWLNWLLKHWLQSCLPAHGCAHDPWHCLCCSDQNTPCGKANKCLGWGSQHSQPTQGCSLSSLVLWLWAPHLCDLAMAALVPIWPCHKGINLILWR